MNLAQCCWCRSGLQTPGCLRWIALAWSVRAWNDWLYWIDSWGVLGALFTVTCYLALQLRHRVVRVVRVGLRLL